MTGRRSAGRGSGQGEQLGLDLDDLLIKPGPRVGSRANRRAQPAPAHADRDPAIAGGDVASDRRLRIGAVEIARALGKPDPTPEQVTVIEAPVEPLLVVAGAGSGKTETMAARVVWLVANRLVAPEEVLGLTFTRKAAGELAERIRARLRALHRRGLCDEPQPVTVSTYHAYAAAVLGDHGLRLGIEPGARLLSEAGAWQLASELVDRWDDPLPGFDGAPTSAAEAVLALAGECAEHLLDPRDVEAMIDDVVSRASGLPDVLDGGGPGKPTATVRRRLVRLGETRALVPVVAAYGRRKRELDLLDFGDQVGLAAKIAREAPEVGSGERERYRVVLLDEYQDTSHAQLLLLRALFGAGHPVAAVGDPHQSIYGWRGASAGNLERFPAEFRTTDGRSATVTFLSTSWRNDQAVLTVANHVSGPLRRPAPWISAAGAGSGGAGFGPAGAAVPGLTARPGAGAGRVRVEWHETVEDEAAAVADFVLEEWAGAGATPRPSVAVMCRARAQIPLLDAALRARGLPVEVVGLGGLLHVPEVADLRAALEVLDDPTRGDSLMRLVTGPAVRLGPRDLEGLGRWARELLRRSGAGARATAASADADVIDERSIVEALDDLPPPGWQGPDGQELSVEGRRRLEQLSATLRGLRARVGIGLPDLVLEIERGLLLDVEVAARPGVRPVVARANLDAFVDVAAAFAHGADAPTLRAFLGWLAAAEQRERALDAGVGQSRADAVQILTVHAAKGLEWDVVAVPGLVEGTFPSRGDGGSPDHSWGWLGPIGAVPFPLRGDRDGLPVWRIEAAGTQKELDAELLGFRDDCGAYEVSEERRLAYVAVTRAKCRLFMCGAVWGDGKTPREPSRFLCEVVALSADGGGLWAADPADGVQRGVWVEQPEDGAANPREALSPRAPWPYDPLGARRTAVEEGAALVRRAVEQPTSMAFDSEEQDWSREVDLLLAERDAGLREVVDIELPAHLSASRVVALATDPVALAWRLRRPMPEQPSPDARRGSAFHAWLERRFGRAALVDLDELPGAADDTVVDEDLEVLQANYLASAWAERTPDAVEVSVETPIGGVIVRGRIDAVFRYPATAQGLLWDLVDWKTGSPPRPGESAARSVQLAVYRLAWARLHDVGLDRVGAAFFYAATGETVRPVELLDEQGLSHLIALAE